MKKVHPTLIECENAVSNNAQSYKLFNKIVAVEGQSNRKGTFRIKLDFGCMENLKNSHKPNAKKNYLAMFGVLKLHFLIEEIILEAKI